MRMNSFEFAGNGMEIFKMGNNLEEESIESYVCIDKDINMFFMLLIRIIQRVLVDDAHLVTHNLPHLSLKKIYNT